MRLASEGYPFIAVFGLLTVLAIFFGQPFPAAVALALTLFMVYFFRDPDREVPDDPDVFVSPADGRVILIKDVDESQYLKSKAKQISIFMSPANVHVNRAPCDGKVLKVRHNKGRYFAAYREEASLRNENIEMLLETAHGNILVRQVAGFLARRAVCRKKEGDNLRQGERYGIIKFSSRVDTYLPEEVEIAVKLNQQVKAGSTILARRKKTQT
jgi:phosphatidylserine decarboxylase